MAGRCAPPMGGRRAGDFTVWQQPSSLAEVNSKGVMLPRLVYTVAKNATRSISINDYSVKNYSYEQSWSTQMNLNTHILTILSRTTLPEYYDILNYTHPVDSNSGVALPMT